MTSKEQSKLPIYYSDKYNIYFGGLEKLHAFDAGKWGKVFYNLKVRSSKEVDTRLQVNENTIYIVDKEVDENSLLKGHSKQYLNSLKSSWNVAKIIEIFFLAVVPNIIVNRLLLKKMRYQVEGTIQAVLKSVEYGWAINIGGGFHHAHQNDGGGFCVYADISIGIKILQESHKDIKITIVDLDAHQGNGHEHDFKDDPNVKIVDFYNRKIYPHDIKAQQSIDLKVELDPFVEDEPYLEQLDRQLDKAIREYKPDLIFYNAGTDCLKGDRLGIMNISEDGIKRRDQIVFTKAKSNGCCIVMVTSGGYQLSNADVIAASIWNLLKQGIIGDKWDNNITNLTNIKAE